MYLLLEYQKLFRCLGMRKFCSQINLDLGRITVPVYLKQQVAMIKRKELRRKLKAIREKSSLGNKNFPVITCKNKDLNFYYGQTYGKHSIMPLASQSWNKNKSIGDHFTICSFGRNPSLPINEKDLEINYEESETPSTFASFGFDERLLEGLNHLGIEKLTPIQKLAIPEVMKHQNVLFSSETGSGKTAAYLVPILQKLMTARDKFHSSSFPPNCPRVVIIVPAKELAEQIAYVAREMGRFWNIRVKLLIQGEDLSIRKYNNPESFDIVVGTVGSVQRMINTSTYSTSLVEDLVIDEADTMLDDSFIEDLHDLLMQFKLQSLPLENKDDQPSGARIILVSATSPRNVAESLASYINVKSMVHIKTSHLHHILPHVPQKFLRVSKDDRPSYLLSLVKKDYNKRRPVMIFTNNAKTCIWLHHMLEESNVSSIFLHGGMPIEEREIQFQKFRNRVETVMSCTDIASRGLDTTWVQHVINYDFPLYMTDYIHRVGRTGRVGSEIDGHVTNLIAYRGSATLIRKIEASVRSMERLPSVDANIKRRLFDKTLKGMLPTS